MKINSVFGKVALGLALCCVCSVEAAQAETTLTPMSHLSAQGVDVRHMEIIVISPDNKFICAKAKVTPDPKSKKFVQTLYIMPIRSDNSIGKVRTFPLEGVTDIEQLCFTPDSQNVVFTTLQGTKFIKVNCETGVASTIIEHVQGQPGFRLNPPIMRCADGKIYVEGFWYSASNVTSGHMIAVLDPDKTGVDAFKRERWIEDVMQGTQVVGCTYTENYPRSNIGFCSVHYTDPQHTVLKAWNGGDTVKQVKTNKELICCWAGANRLLYSATCLDETNELCIYDAVEDKTYTIDKERERPYLYTFLSADGKTAMFSADDNDTGSSTTLYARESEGWKISPIKGMEKRATSGIQRLSDDGTKMIFKNPEGIRVADVTDK